jgi:hypothetical protein
MTKTQTQTTEIDFSINERFGFLGNLTTMVVADLTPSLLVTGTAGIGKTHSVTKTIEQNNLTQNDFLFIKGYSTARGLYNTLYDNNGKLIIFDDCDSVLEDKVAINILKSALDSYEKRTITWSARMTKGDVYPQSFDFTGRIIFISNKSKDKIDKAILSRSLTVDLSMTADEKIERMEFILENILPDYEMEIKQDAINFLKENKDCANLNLRTLIMVSKVRLFDPTNWQNLSRYMLNA